MKESCRKEASSIARGQRILPPLLASLLAGATWLPASEAYEGGSPGRSRFEESEARIAFLLVFAKYVEWPGTTLPADGPLVIGVMGDSPLGSARETGLHGRRVVIKRFLHPAELQPCHILYFPADQEPLLPKLREQLAASGVLTVGESAGFIGSGGSLQLFNEAGRLRFTINCAVLDHSKLKVEANALMLAKQVLYQPVEAAP